MKQNTVSQSVPKLVLASDLELYDHFSFYQGGYECRLIRKGDFASDYEYFSPVSGEAKKGTLYYKVKDGKVWNVQEVYRIEPSESEGTTVARLKKGDRFQVADKMNRWRVLNIFHETVRAKLISKANITRIFPKSLKVKLI